jgi:regulatory protein
VKDTSSPKRLPPPLNATHLRALALHYVGRYATTRRKLADYLSRKIRERGWQDDRSADIAGLVESFSELGYVNDAQFAEARGRSFVRKGLGKRRLDDELRAAGIVDSDARNAHEHAEVSAFLSAENFARRKHVGPFARQSVEPDKRQKQLQAFLRAGHSYDIAKMFVFADPGDVIEDI